MRDPSDPYADERAIAADRDWTRERHETERAQRLQAITNCALCDQDGYRGTTVCDHQDHTESAQRGIAAIRAQMGWQPPTPQTHPEKRPQATPDPKNHT